MLCVVCGGDAVLDTCFCPYAPAACKLIMRAMSLWTWAPRLCACAQGSKKPTPSTSEPNHKQHPSARPCTCRMQLECVRPASVLTWTQAPSVQPHSQQPHVPSTKIHSKAAPTAIHRLRSRERPAGPAMTLTRDSAEHLRVTPQLTPPERRGTCRFTGAVGINPLAS